MDEYTVKNLEDLIQKSVGPTKKIVETHVKQLTAPGENYLGIVVKVEAVVKNEKGEEKDFNAVAKCVNLKIPEIMRKTVPLQFRKENGFYTEIVPTLEEFQKEIGLEEKGVTDIFPTLYTSRFSLDENSEEPDDDAVLFFEYLGDKGYVNADRTVGFDLDGAKLILKDLAAFHAIPLALKLKKPDVFKERLNKYFTNIWAECNFEDLPSPPPDQEKPEVMWLRILEPYDEVKPYKDLLKAKLMKSQEEFMQNFKREATEPFATISHADLWTNNTMQIFSDGKPIENKFLDFQIYMYGSAATDVIFFLWSSVQQSVLQDHFDDLIKFYHDNFINLLDKCGCDIAPFCYDNFLKEVDEQAKLEFSHIMVMLVPIYGKKGEAAFDAEDKDPSFKENKISEIARKRTAFIVSSFGKRGWLE